LIGTSIIGYDPNDDSHVTMGRFQWFKHELLYANPYYQVAKSMLPVLLIGFFLVILLLTLSPEVERALADSVIATILVGKFPQAIIFNPSNNNIYVANRDSGTVSVIESTNIL
jgi:hypothetical protein